MILLPFQKKYIAAEERKRLQKIVEAIKEKNFGVIVRTAAEGKNTAELHEDLTTLNKYLENHSKKFERVLKHL